MTGDDTPSQVRAAAAALIAAFARSDANAYFACFAPDATFLFHTTAGRLSSRADYERLWARWVAEDGFRVLSCESSEAAVDLPGAAGDVAVFSHRVRTVVQTTSGQETVNERETIVFARAGDHWLAVHEHLSPDPGGPVQTGWT